MLCWNSAHYELAGSEMGRVHGRWLAQGSVVTLLGCDGQFHKHSVKFVQNFVHLKLLKSADFWPNY